MNTDLAWLAGVFDGEGSVVIGRSGGKYKLALSLVSVSRELIDRVKEIAGGRIITVYPKNARRTTWMWQLTGIEKIQRFLKQIFPFLTAKAKPAAIALVYPIVSRGGKVGRVGRNIHPLARLLQEECYKAIRFVNQGFQPFIEEFESWAKEAEAMSVEP